MTKGREKRLLEALVLFVDFMSLEEDGCVCSSAMSEREEAMDVLVGYGLLEWLDDVFQCARWTSAGEDFRTTVYRNHPNEDFEAEFPELPSSWAEDPLLVAEAAATIETSTDAPLVLGDRERFALVAVLRLADGYPRCPRALVATFTEYGFVESSVEEFVKEYGCSVCYVTWSAGAKEFWDAGRITRQSHRNWSRGR